MGWGGAGNNMGLSWMEQIGVTLGHSLAMHPPSNCVDFLIFFDPLQSSFCSIGYSCFLFVAQICY